MDRTSELVRRSARLRCVSAGSARDAATSPTEGCTIEAAEPVSENEDDGRDDQVTKERLHVRWIEGARMYGDGSLELHCFFDSKGTNSWLFSDKTPATEAWESIYQYFTTLTSGRLVAFLICIDPNIIRLAWRARQDLLATEHVEQSIGAGDGETAEVHVKKLDGTKIALQVAKDGGTTIGALKLMIFRKDGAPPDQQNLYFEGRRYADQSTFADNRIPIPATIHMTLRLRGGKPVIYIYPTKPINCTVNLMLSPVWELTHFYPVTPYHNAYCASWKVIAQPNGNLTVNNPHHRIPTPYLFWEAETTPLPVSPKPDGTPGDPVSVFALRNEDTMTLAVDSTFWIYLDKTLRILRMDDKQRADFITYWMADISPHQYLAFRFLTQDEINFAAELQIDPVPELVYRVFLVFGKGREEDVIRSGGRTEARSSAHAVGGRPDDNDAGGANAEGGEADSDVVRTTQAKQRVQTDWTKVVEGGMDMAGWKKDKFSVLEWGGMVIPEAEDAENLQARSQERAILSSRVFGTPMEDMEDEDTD